MENDEKANDVNNYRGITILSCTGKIFTTMSNVRLTKFCNDNSFVKEMTATTNHVLVIKNLVNSFPSKKKKKLYYLYIDYMKPFDLV